MRIFTLTPQRLALFLVPYAALTAHPDERFYQGVVHAPQRDAAQIRIRLDDAGEELRGALDLPFAGSLGIPLTGAERGRRDIELSFLNGEYVFQGRFRRDALDGALYLDPTETRIPVELAPVSDPRPYTARDVVFPNRDLELAGTVFTPEPPGPHPAIMLIHGSGDNERWVREYMADFFVRHGFVTLFYDKRGNGLSEGDWKTVGFGPLAQDAIAGLRFLQSLPTVDADRVGLWGISQAGWIMPLAASMSDAIAFIVVTSGTTVSVAEEIKYDYLVNLRDRGFPEADIAKAEAILDKDHEVTMTGEGYDELRATVKDIRTEPWWRELGFFLLPPSAKPQIRLIGDFDPRPVLEKVDIPILWIYGEDDKSVDPEPAIAILDALIETYDKPWTIRTFPHADHGLRVPPPSNAPLPLRTLAPGYLDAIADWLDRTVVSADS